MEMPSEQVWNVFTEKKGTKGSVVLTSVGYF